MLPYGRQSISEEDIEAVTAVLRGDWLTTGPAVTAFEEAVSEVAGGHRAVSCTSGTAALHIAYAALGVGPGDQVVTTPMTFVATASGASLLGAEIVFADVEEDTALLDPAAVEAAVTDRTRVVAAVDYAGHPADYDALQPIADRVGAVTLDDAAHSVGGTLPGPAGGQPGRRHHALVLPDQEPHHGRGRRRGVPRRRGGPARPRVPLHRAGPRPGQVRHAPTRVRGTRRSTSSG